MLDPGLRRDDPAKGSNNEIVIPACAGMTLQKVVVMKSSSRRRPGSSMINELNRFVLIKEQ